MNRLPALSEQQWSDEQRQLAEEIINGPRGALLPPFEPLLRSPELMAHAQRMGEYLRYRSALGQRLSELAILLTARHWSQPVEWAIHAPIAREKGIPAQAVQAINERRQPEALAADEWVVYHFCQQLHQHKKVSDDIWQQAIDLWGEKGVVDLIGINGYYSFLSMIMNGAQTPVPDTNVKTAGGGKVKSTGETDSILPQKYGFALQKNSSLTPKVDAALNALRADGTYDKIYFKWFNKQPK